MTAYEYQQPWRRRQSGPYAANAVTSPNLAKTVVVVAAVLGSESAEGVVTSSLVTRGTRASRPAKYGRSPRELAVDSQTRLND